MGGTGLEPVTPSLSIRGSRSRQFAGVRSGRMVERNPQRDRTLERTRTNADPCHSCHAAPARPQGRRQVRSLQCLAIAVMSGSDLQRRLNEAVREVERVRTENERLRTLLALAQQTKTILGSSRPEPPPESACFPGSADEKVALVRRLFRGRDDVYALRWESARTGRSGYTPATAEGWSRQGPKTYLPLGDEAVERHLLGRESIGVYPLLEDDTCWFLACD